MKQRFSRQLAWLTAVFVLGFFLPPHTHADTAKPDVKAWKSDRAQGQRAREKKQLPQAVEFFKAALSEARKFDPKDDRLADSLMDLAEAYTAEGDLAAAEPLLQEAAEIRHGDPNVGLEAASLDMLAFVSSRLRHYDVAAKTYERLEQLAVRKFGASDPKTVRYMYERGKMCFLLGDYTQAEPLLKRSVNLLEHPASKMVARESAAPGLKDFYIESYHPDYIHALDGLSRLSTIYTSQNRLGQAEACLKESLKIVDDNASKGDPALPNALSDLSKYYISLTNYPAAEPILQRQVKFDEKYLGATKQGTLDSEDQLARVYEQEKKYTEAEALFQKVLADCDAGPGQDSRESVVALGGLAKFYVDREQYEKAEPLYRRQLVHAEKFSGGGVMMLTPILADQVTIYTKLGRDAELVDVYKKQIEVFEKMLGPNTPALVKPLTDCAALLRKMKRDAEAEPLEARARAIQPAGK